VETRILTIHNPAGRFRLSLRGPFLTYFGFRNVDNPNAMYFDEQKVVGHVKAESNIALSAAAASSATPQTTLSRLQFSIDTDPYSEMKNGL
jgi:hypothetical protein